MTTHNEEMSMLEVAELNLKNSRKLLKKYVKLWD